MTEKVGVRFYRITRCGYYQRGAKQAEFGDPAELLHSLRAWGVPRALKNTKLFEASEDGDILPVYLSSIDERRGTWLLGLWNETPTYKAGAASISATARVGKARPRLTGQDPDQIFGFPTYFWFLPDLSIYATLKLQQDSLGQRAMQRYLDCFLREDPAHVVLAPRQDPETSPERVGYVATQGETPQPLIPDFAAAPAVNPGEREYLLENVEDIRRIVRKAELRVRNNAQEKAYWQRLTEFLYFPQRDEKRETVRLRYEMEQRFTKEELEATFARWDASNPSQYEDLGFILSGTATPRWLSHSAAKGEVSLKFEWQDETETLVKPDSLLSALEGAKRILLRSLK